MCHHHPPPTPKLLIVKEHSGKKVLIVKKAQNDPLLTHPAPKKMTRWTDQVQKLQCDGESKISYKQHWVKRRSPKSKPYCKTDFGHWAVLDPRNGRDTSHVCSRKTHDSSGYLSGSKPRETSVTISNDKYIITFDVHCPVLNLPAPDDVVDAVSGSMLGTSAMLGSLQTS